MTFSDLVDTKACRIDASTGQEESGKISGSRTLRLHSTSNLREAAVSVSVSSNSRYTMKRLCDFFILWHDQGKHDLVHDSHKDATNSGKTSDSLLDWP